MIFLKKPPYLETKIENKNIGLSEISTMQLFAAAFSESKSIFPPISGEDSDKIEAIQGLVNITIAGPAAITCELVTKYLKATEEDKKEESTPITVMINEIN